MYLFLLIIFLIAFAILDVYLYCKYSFYCGWMYNQKWWRTILGSGYIFWYKHIRGKNV